METNGAPMIYLDGYLKNIRELLLVVFHCEVFKEDNRRPVAKPQVRTHVSAGVTACACVFMCLHMT